MLNISSNPVLASTKAYCPLMGNLQSEFHFFIKNQQARDEKAALLYRLSLTHSHSHTHFSYLSTVVSQFIIITFLFPPLPIERGGEKIPFGPECAECDSYLKINHVRNQPEGNDLFKCGL